MRSENSFIRPIILIWSTHRVELGLVSNAAKAFAKATHVHKIECSKHPFAQQETENVDTKHGFYNVQETYNIAIVRHFMIYK